MSRDKAVKYEVDDRVVCVVEYDNVRVGYEGTVLKVDGDGKESIGVEWDEAIDGGHNLVGYAQEGHGWWVSPSHIKHADVDSLDTAVVAQKSDDGKHVAIVVPVDTAVIITLLCGSISGTGPVRERTDAVFSTLTECGVGYTHKNYKELNSQIKGDLTIKEAKRD